VIVWLFARCISYLMLLAKIQFVIGKSCYGPNLSFTLVVRAMTKIRADFSLDRRLGGPQNRSGRRGEEGNPAPHGTRTPPTVFASISWCFEKWACNFVLACRSVLVITVFCLYSRVVNSLFIPRDISVATWRCVDDVRLIRGTPRLALRHFKVLSSNYANISGEWG
jgi:hypothetical protein